jgi:hypothetical protein
MTPARIRSGEFGLASVLARPGREAEVLVHGARPAAVPAHQIALPDRHAAMADGASGAVDVVGGHLFLCPEEDHDPLTFR